MTQWGLDTLFNPAKRHMDEEKRRLQSTRAEQGDSSGGKRIDLESGKVRIRRDDQPDGGADNSVDDDVDAGRDVDTDGDQGGTAAPTRTTKVAAPDAARASDARLRATTSRAGHEPSAAAIRAAARRGRAPR